MDPGVRVDPIHFRDGALELDGAIRVELGCEGVMRQRGRRSNRQERPDGNTDELHAHCSHLRSTQTFY